MTFMESLIADLVQFSRAFTKHLVLEGRLALKFGTFVKSPHFLRS